MSYLIVLKQYDSVVEQHREMYINENSITELAKLGRITRK